VVLESSQPEVLDSLGSLLLGPVLLELGDLGGLVLVVLIVRVGSFAGGDLLGGGLDLAGDDLGSAGVEGVKMGGKEREDRGRCRGIWDKEGREETDLLLEGEDLELELGLDLFG
jgi:hypothetical protein